MINQIKKHFLYRIGCLFIAALIGGCSITTPRQNTTEPPPKNHAIYDSTVYFAKRTASVSLRASFLNQPSNVLPGGPPAFAKGYKLQFRSISKTNRSISQASIIAGGKKIALTPEAFFIPLNKGATLSISLEDTNYIHQYNNAILRFKYNNESVFFTISNNQISEFIP